MDVEELKANAPIIPYIKKFYKDKIPIVKEGKNGAFVKCIFHDEKTASLALFRDTNKFKCFGCGEYGDLINIVQHMEDMNFKEACMEIGKNVGYDVKFKKLNPYWERHRNNLQEHSRRYWTNLQNNEYAYKYVTETRGITPKMINAFHLGLTDEDEYKYRNDIGKISNKIAFPILEHTKNPRPVGFAYRELDGSKPKYINDHNLDGRKGQDPHLDGAFTKGDMLYGMPMAKKGIRQKGYAIITEGYFDVISLHQSEFNNAVGIMGIGISPTQIEDISKMTDRVILMLDSDEAGRKGMLAIINKMINYDLDIYVCDLDKYHDADEMCHELNCDSNAIGSYIKTHITNAYMYIINHITENYVRFIDNERMKILSKVEPFCNSINSNFKRDMFMSMLKKKLDI